MNSITRLDSQREVEAIQLATLGKLLPQTSVSFVSRALLRFESEFLKRSWPDRARFGLFVARWAKQRVVETIAGSRAQRQALKELEGAPKDAKTLRIAVLGTGSIGDFLTHVLFMEAFYLRYCPAEIDFYCRPAKVGHAKELFKRAAFIKRIVPTTYLDRLRDEYDVVVEIRHMPKYDIRNYKRVLNICPDLLADISVAAQRFEPHHFMFDRHPFLDGLFAKQQALAGRNAADVIGHYGNVNVDRNTAPFLSPDISQYDVLDRFGLADKPYITLHDGFDTEHLSTTSRVTKCWPPEHWNEFARLFKSEFPDVLMVQIGASHSARIEGVDVSLLNKTTLNEAGLVIKHALMHVDGESGMARIARALHTTSAVMFGPTSAPFFAFDRNVNIVSTACTDCWWSTQDWNSNCPRQLKQPECMTSISPKRVANVVAAFVKAKRDRRAKYVIDGFGLYGADLSSVGGVEDIRQTLDAPDIDSHESGICTNPATKWTCAFGIRVLRNRGRDLAIAVVGGGRGALAPCLARLGYDVTLYDPDYGADRPYAQEQFIAWARENGLKVRFASPFNLPAENDAFDVLFSTSVIERVPHKRYALQEALRVVRPGGLLALSFGMATDRSHMSAGLRDGLFAPEHLRAVLQQCGIEKHWLAMDAIEHGMRETNLGGVAGVSGGTVIGAIAIRKVAVLG